jgi:glycosyltransferase involved in cell wall biosynthesis
MKQRLLLVSTLDSSQPFGAFTRPFYLGQHLSKKFEVYQLGIDCSAVDYTAFQSIGSRSLKMYIKSVMKQIDEFRPNLIYAQETLPGLASLVAFTLKRRKNCTLVFDFHTFSAFEYWSRLSSVANPFKEFLQLIKTYIAQGLLIFSGNPIIAAGESTPVLISQWYGRTSRNIYCIGNGVTEEFLNSQTLVSPDPYAKLRPAKIAVLVAPKTFQFPSNDMSVSMAVDIAKHLESKSEQVHLVIIGRDAKDIQIALPSNITFTGFLPTRADFLAHLQYADICLLTFPRQAVAGGARNKALDYFASKKLVISTPEGLRGLEEFQHQKHLLVAEYPPKAFADTILDASLNLEKYQPLVERAYTLIQEKYSWNAKAQDVVQVFMQALGN